MFTITTYPDGQLTKYISKADAGKRCIQGKVETFDSIESLVERASQVPISPSELKGGRRAASNFVSASIIVIDVDDIMTLPECTAVLDMAQIEYAIYTSFSHTQENHKFHVIIPTETLITTESDYKATYDHVAKTIFGSINDGQTCSTANLFFNSNPENKEIVIYQKTSEITRIPVQKGKPSVTLTPLPSKTPSPVLVEGDRSKHLSKRTLRFLSTQPEPGKWHTELTVAIQNLKAAKYTKEEATHKLMGITGTLTENDLYQIDYGYKNDNWNYSLEVLGKEPHPLRLKYTNATTGKRIPIPSREIVEAFIMERNVKITAGGNIKSGVNDTDLGVLKEYIRDYAETELETRIPLSTIESIISAIREEQRLKQLHALKERIKFTGASFDFESWCVALMGKEDKITIAIMKHFIWQIKRKLADKEVKYPIMPVFYGKSGAGKSYHLRHHILKPIKDIVYFDGDFHKLVDSREAYNLASHYVYFLDEMSKAEHADVETIKNKITSDTIQYRKLGTNETVRATNKVTFVGTTNLPLNNVIKDPTSARRFFEVKITEQMDFKKISSMNYEHMWQSIDESTDEDPFFLENREAIERLQETFRHKSVIEEFLLEHEYSNDLDAVGDKLTRKEIYDSFKVWIGDSGYRHPINKHAFAQSIRDKLGEPITFKRDCITHIGYIKLKQNKDG